MNIKNNKIAHRGVFNNTTIPENSLKAFRKALSLNYSVELDVQLTKDNILVVFHDDNLRRMTGVRKKIQDVTYEELRTYRLLDTKEKIPTLQEVLQLIQDKVLVNIEIKNTTQIEKICNILIKELKEYHNFVIQSFNPRIIRFLKTHYPTLTVGYIINKKYLNKIYTYLLSSNLIIKYSKADFLSIHKDLLFKQKYQRLKKKYPLFVWTIKEKDTISNDEYVLICNDLK